MTDSSKPKTTQAGGSQVVNLYLPPGAIRSMGRYLNSGFRLTIIVEDFEGRNIRRYIANNNLILYSEEVDDAVTDLAATDKEDSDE